MIVTSPIAKIGAALLLVCVAGSCSHSKSFIDPQDADTPSSDQTNSSSAAVTSDGTASGEVSSGADTLDGAASSGLTSDSLTSDSATTHADTSLDGASPEVGALDADTLDGATLDDAMPLTDAAAPNADAALDAQQPNLVSPLSLDLGAAGDYVILAKSGISTVPSSAVTGNMGVSPAAATYITGFSLTADSSNVFALSPQVTGMVFAADYAAPTPSNLTTAVGDMELAFADAAGRAPDHTELGAGDIGGMSLAPGVYKWGTGLLVPTDITLAGGPNDVWIFQIAQDLNLSSGTHVELTGGALPQHVFWQVAGLVELGTTAHAEGIILAQTSITLKTGASLNGRLLAQTAVNLDANSIVEPALD